MLYQSNFGEQVEKIFWNALSDMILLIQFNHLASSLLLCQSARSGQVILHGVRS